MQNMMQKILTLSLAAGLTGPALAAALEAGHADHAPTAAAAPLAAPVFKDDREAISYALGVQTARSIKKLEGEVRLEMVIRGLKDGMSGERLMVDEKELKHALDVASVEMRRGMAANKRALSEENKKKGDAFLAENGKKEGVVTLPSGVQYKIVKAGTGAKPRLSDTVMINYRGTRLDGYQFDASPVGKPARMNVMQLINGWKEVLQMMPTGSHWQIAIPPRHAYGDRGVGQDIGPFETLLFDVELVEVKSMASPAAAASAAAGAKASAVNSRPMVPVPAASVNRLPSEVALDPKPAAK